MDILEILGKIGFDWQVAVANTVNFLIIFWLLSRYAFKPIAAIIKKRQDMISEGLDSAQKAETELLMARKEGQEIVQNAKQEANTIVASAKDRGDALVTDATGKAQIEADALVTRARESMDKERAEMTQEIKNHAADLVVSGVQKILQDDLTKEQNDGLAKRALSVTK